MKCPNCDQLLQITHRQNIEIDYCPTCRGIWLDKGELDKLIDFSNQQVSQTPKSRSNDDYDDNNKGYNFDQKKENRYNDNRNYVNKYPKKKSFLGDIFDF